MSDWRDPIHPGVHLADELEEIGMNGLLYIQPTGTRLIRSLQGITNDQHKSSPFHSPIYN